MNVRSVDPPSVATPTSLVGFEVEIHGLTGRPELNGRCGMATGVKGCRVAVSVLGAGTVALKPTNLKRRSQQSQCDMPAHIDDEERLRKGCDQERNAKDPCGDGDQSQLSEISGPGQHLRELWARGADLNPWMDPHRYSPFFASCAWGDVLAAETFLRAARVVELERRESHLRYSPLHVCVAGSRMIYGSIDWPRRAAPKTMGFNLPELVPDHCAIAKLLIEQRARVDARDILGHTPLALACGTHATEGSLRVARVLATGSASLDVVDRFGNPMWMTVMLRPNGGVRYDVIESLLQMGADPHKKFDLQPVGMMSMHEAARKFSFVRLNLRRRR